MALMRFHVQRAGGKQLLEMEYERLFVVGYSGRDMEKTRAHIRELEEQLGVPAPHRIPTIFECSCQLLTQEEKIKFVGEKTSGEAEYIIVFKDGKVYIGLGSDHTDRHLEQISVPKAKQVCPKPVGKELWDYDEIRTHWDQIRLRSYQVVDGREVLYQDGLAADILPVETILSELKDRKGDIDNSIIFSGTVPLLGGFLYGSKFRCEMIDETLGRKLTCGYRVEVIPEE